MALRYYVAPVIGSGTRQDPYTLKAKQIITANNLSASAAYWWQTDAASHPVSTWGLAVIRTADFTAFDGDATLDDLFGGNVPAAIDTADEMVSYLQANTVGDVPLARRNRITAVLDKYAVPRADFTLATTLHDVLARVFVTIFGAAIDPNVVISGFFV